METAFFSDLEQSYYHSKIWISKGITPDFDDFSPPPPLTKISRSLKPRYTSNFLLTMTMQFQQIIALPSHTQFLCTSNVTFSETLQKY